MPKAQANKRKKYSWPLNSRGLKCESTYTSKPIIQRSTVKRLKEKQKTKKTKQRSTVFPSSGISYVESQFKSYGDFDPGSLAPLIPHVVQGPTVNKINIIMLKNIYALKDTFKKVKDKLWKGRN